MDLEKSTTLLLDHGQQGLEERSRVALAHGCAGVEGAVWLCAGPWADVQAAGEILGFYASSFSQSATKYPPKSNLKEGSLTMGMVMEEVRAADHLGSTARKQKDAMGTPSANGLWDAGPLWVWSPILDMGYCGTILL